MKLKVGEILDATKGRLLRGSLSAAVSGVSIDSRSIAGGELFIPLQGSHYDGHLFITDAFQKGAKVALLQEGKAFDEKAIKAYPDKVLVEVKDPFRALGDVAQCWRKKFSTSLVAITGSNGKTTTKELAWKILSRKFRTIKNPGNWNNLIGLPLTLFQLTGNEQIGIIEMGMSARGEIHRLAEIAVPQIGLIMNIGPAHLEQLGSIESVMEAKGELFEMLNPENIAIVNTDDTRVVALAKKTRASILAFGLHEGDVRAARIKAKKDGGCVFDLYIAGVWTTVNLGLPSEPFVSNALAAAAIAHAFQMNTEDIQKGLEEFTTIPGRMQIMNLGGITIINDSYNANPVSMEASLKVLSNMKGAKRGIAVLGDMLELGAMAAEFHRSLGRQAAACKLDLLFVCGDFSACVSEGAQLAGMQAEQIFTFKNHARLSEQLAHKIKPGDCILVKGSRAMGMEKIIELLRPKIIEE
jgi:UDP-N-acetylmuramoyl-tripeptide--D-alanyl-D-alanine ligase